MFLSALYTWKQTDEWIDISIPLKGTSHKKLDVMACETVLKVSFSPYLLDLDLAHAIDGPNSKAIRHDGVLHLYLKKKDPITARWETLCFTGTKEERQKRRKESLVSLTDTTNKLHELAKKQRWEEQQMTLREQMKLDEREHTRIDQLKEIEKQNAQKTILRALAGSERRGHHEAKSQESVLEKKSHSGVATECLEDNATGSKIQSAVDKDLPQCSASQKNMKKDVEASTSSVKDNKSLKASTKKAPSVVAAASAQPPPRSKCKTYINYTPRLFKTPQRISCKQQEEQFVTKYRPYLKTNRFLNQDAVHATEYNPLWLIEKADSFAINMNFKSAIEVYTSALNCLGITSNKNDNQSKHIGDMDHKIIANIFSKRAKCFLQCCQIDLCSDDCNLCLKHVDEIFSNEKTNYTTSISGSDSTLKVIKIDVFMMKYTALCYMGRVIDAYDTIRQLMSLKIIEHDNDLSERLASDSKWIDTECRAMSHKMKGDELLNNSGNIKAAMEYYELSMNLFTTQNVGVYGNMSLCYLLEGQYENCIELCTTCLNNIKSIMELQKRPNSIEQPSPLFIYIHPAKHMEWNIILLTRRGMAKKMIGETKGAMLDFYQALDVAGNDQTATNMLSKQIKTIISVLECEIHSLQ